MNEKLFFTLRNCIISLIINSCFIEVDTIKYSWLENNDKFDCVVGISVNDKPVSIGTILWENLIVTSANPIERFNEVEHVKIHTIDGDFKKSKARSVFKMTKDQAKRSTGGHWRTFGFDNRHAPHHDLILISPTENIKLFTGARKPIRCQFSGANATFDSDGFFSYVGFGFIDRPHVKQNVELELVEYDYEEVFAECSEWVPFVWGNFICLYNLEYFVGVSSGGGLFYNDEFVGVGSFGIKRGNVGILLFTDVRKYWWHLIYYVPPKNKP